MSIFTHAGTGNPRWGRILGFGGLSLLVLVSGIIAVIAIFSNPATTTIQTATASVPLIEAVSFSASSAFWLGLLGLIVLIISWNITNAKAARALGTFAALLYIPIMWNIGVTVFQHTIGSGVLATWKVVGTKSYYEKQYDYADQTIKGEKRLKSLNPYAADLEMQIWQIKPGIVSKPCYHFEVVDGKETLTGDSVLVREGEPFFVDQNKGIHPLFGYRGILVTDSASVKKPHKWFFIEPQYVMLREMLGGIKDVAAGLPQLNGWAQSCTVDSLSVGARYAMDWGDESPIKIPIVNGDTITVGPGDQIGCYIPDASWRYFGDNVQQPPAVLLMGEEKTPLQFIPNPDTTGYGWMTGRWEPTRRQQLSFQVQANDQNRALNLWTKSPRGQAMVFFVLKKNLLAKR